MVDWTACAIHRGHLDKRTVCRHVVQSSLMEDCTIELMVEQRVLRSIICDTNMLIAASYYLK